MKRREFIALIASAGAWPLAARAQMPGPAHKIGYLHPVSLELPSYTLGLIRPVWQKLGYVEGETLLLRSAADLSQLPTIVAELSGFGTGVLIVVGPAAVRATAQVTKTIPIVAIALETDPVRAGLASSINRPGGNGTGFFLDQSSLAGKGLQLLREAVPSIERVALIWEPNSGTDQRDAAMAAASAMGLEPFVLEMRTSDGYEAAFQKLAIMGSQPKTGIIQLASPVLISPYPRLGEESLKHRLPTMSFFKPQAKAGALMSYGPNLEAYYPRAAILADRILKGAKPAELPIEQPDRFELVINLKTAKALGIEIPPSLLALADELIE